MSDNNYFNDSLSNSKDYSKPNMVETPDLSSNQASERENIQITNQQKQPKKPPAKNTYLPSISKHVPKQTRPILQSPKVSPPKISKT